jgi:hypothetical protein
MLKNEIVFTLFFLLMSILTEFSSSNIETTNELNTKLNYPHYSYKHSSKFEHRFQNVLSKCETETDCSKYSTYMRQNCLLKCISRNCYSEIYEFDPLEDGEIDQRLSSFKGCYSAEINKT